MSRLKDFTEERGVRLLTVRCTNAWLERSTLFVELSEDDEIFTNSRERITHFESIETRWLQNQLASQDEKVMIATPDHPLEVLTGDVCPILQIEEEDYILSFYRDIMPQGWLIPGGCPRSLDELLNPKLIAVREAAEEILIGDKSGNVYPLPDSKIQLEANLEAWKLESNTIIPLNIKEVPLKWEGITALVIRTKDKETKTEGSFTVDPFIGAVDLTLYWRIELPVKLSELKIWDGERLPDRPLNRPARLTDRKGRTKALFSGGNNILSASWMNPETRTRATLPFSDN